MEEKTNAYVRRCFSLTRRRSRSVSMWGMGVRASVIVRGLVAASWEGYVFIPLLDLVGRGELVMRLGKDNKTNLLANYGFLKKVSIRNVRSCLYLAYIVTECSCGVAVLWTVGLDEMIYMDILTMSANSLYRRRRKLYSRCPASVMFSPTSAVLVVPVFDLVRVVVRIAIVIVVLVLAGVLVVIHMVSSTIWVSISSASTGSQG
jgi:hypothetical protein